MLLFHAAAFVARALILARSAGVSRFYWYAWDNMDMGLIEPGTQELKSAAQAYDSVARWLTGNNLVDCNKAGTVWTCDLLLDNGHAAWIVWSDSDRGDQWKIPATFSVEAIEELDGTRTKPTASFVHLTGMPVLLRSLQTP